MWYCSGYGDLFTGISRYRALRPLRGILPSELWTIRSIDSFRGDFFFCASSSGLHCLCSALAVGDYFTVQVCILSEAVGAHRQICPAGYEWHDFEQARFARNFTCKHARGTLNLHRKGRADRTSAPVGLTLRACNQHFINSSPSRTQEFTARAWNNICNSAFTALPIIAT